MLGPPLHRHLPAAREPHRARPQGEGQPRTEGGGTPHGATGARQGLEDILLLLVSR